MRLLDRLGIKQKKGDKQIASSSDEGAEPAGHHQESDGATDTDVPEQATESDQPQTRSDTVDPSVLLSEAMSQKGLLLEQSNKLHRRTVLGLLGLNLIQGMGWLHASRQEKEFMYFFTNSDGSVIDAKPMSDPIHSQAVVRNFLSKSIAELFSFHYRNVEMHLQRMAPDILTDQAFKDVVAELDRMGLVRQMKERREVAVTTIPDTPVLTASGTQNGIHAWEYASRINILLEGAERSSGSGNRGRIRQLSGQLRAQLIRVPPEVHPRRVLINRLQIFEEGAR